MADADHTTTPSAVSRRHVLSGAATAPALLTPGFWSPPDADPVLPLWREWRRIHARVGVLCGRWQRLESHLVRAAGFPLATQAVSGPCPTATGSGLNGDEAPASGRRHAETEAGLRELERLQDEALDQKAVVCRSVFRAQAISLAGIEAKLELIVQLCLSGSEDPEAPVPQLRSTLADLKRLRVRWRQ